MVSRLATAVLLGALTGPIGEAVEAAVGEDSDFFHLGGPNDLLDKTKDEWARLKEKLDWEAAWPIGLVYGNSIIPWDQHQVLAIGYSDTGNGKAILKVWDNNDHDYDHQEIGAEVRELILDFNGDELQVGNYDKPIKGFFVEEYSPTKPPDILNLS
jgi:hypothetical protein